MDWISVKERLPILKPHSPSLGLGKCATHLSERVLFVHEYLGKQWEIEIGYLAQWDESESEHSFGEAKGKTWMETGRFVPGTVTHWMPLPEPPIS